MSHEAVTASREDDLPPVAEGIFRRAAGGGEAELIGGRCAACGRHFFPRPEFCPYCLRPAEETGLGGRGTVYSYTKVCARPPFGLPAPYGVGYVDLDDSGLRVFGLFDPDRLDELRLGLTVRLASAQLGENTDGTPCVRPYFSPADNRSAE